MKRSAARLAPHSLAPAPQPRAFKDSEHYWEARYAAGGRSGTGSNGPEAAWKAQVANGSVAGHGFESVVGWRRGDGNQLTLAR